MRGIRQKGPEEKASGTNFRTAALRRRAQPIELGRALRARLRTARQSAGCGIGQSASSSRPCACSRRLRLPQRQASGAAHEAGAQRVALDLTADCEQMILGRDQEGAVAALVEVAGR